VTQHQRNLLALSPMRSAVTAWCAAARGYRVQPAPGHSAGPGDLTIAPPLRDSGYELLTRPGHPADSLLTSAAVNAALARGAASPLVVSSTGFRAPFPPLLRYALLARFTRQKHTVLFNGGKIRLRSDPLLAGPGELQPSAIQPTRYFDTLVTNDAVRLNVTTRDGRTVFSGAGYCFPAGVIPDCRDSRCANQFGTTALALTSDDYFVIAGQGTGNAIHPGKWTAPGSGSADWADTRGVADLQDLIRAAAVRELAEETGLTPDDIEWIRVIGYGRLLERGGLPQFFFLARLRRSLAALRITRSERSLVDYHAQLHFGPRPPFRASVAAVRAELLRNSARVSSSLWWCTELLSRLPEDDLSELLVTQAENTA
jgi:8-oxo-dGTP pyrophosphatase MutT (NUDIX family)